MNIQNIDINLIDQHPENPRKDLGDLTELANSIKESGIHQNLTVVRKGKHFERYAQLNELFNGMNERLMSFAKSLPERKGSVSIALRLAAEIAIIDEGMLFEDTDFEDIADVDSDEMPKDDLIANGKLPTELLYIAEKTPTSGILQLILSKHEVDKADYYCRFDDSPASRCIVRAFETLGYSFTDEECKLLNGTHELYVKEQSNG